MTLLHCMLLVSFLGLLSNAAIHALRFFASGRTREGAITIEIALAGLAGAAVQALLLAPIVVNHLNPDAPWEGVIMGYELKTWREGMAAIFAVVTLVLGVTAHSYFVRKSRAELPAQSTTPL